MASSKDYDLIVVGSGFAGSMATLNFLEECKKQNKNGRVALVEFGKDDEDWVKEMRLVSNGLADEDYCNKLCKEAPVTAKYLQEHGVRWVHHDEPNVLLEFKTDQHFVFP